jgi:hypothetical protein
VCFRIGSPIVIFSICSHGLFFEQTAVIVTSLKFIEER